MKIKEGYIAFKAKDITFYDTKDFLSFQKSFLENYDDYLYKVNGIKIKKGKKRIIPVRTDKQISYQELLKLSVETDFENETMSINGYGNSHMVIPLQVKLRDMFEEKQIFTYESDDHLVKTIECDGYENLSDECLKRRNEKVKIYK